MFINNFAQSDNEFSPIAKQAALDDESLSFQFFDVIVILLTYCGPELLTNGASKSAEKNETQAVVIDLVATLGFYCANNKKNQVSKTGTRKLNCKKKKY